jgi:hypothetical protein
LGLLSRIIRRLYKIPEWHACLDYDGPLISSGAVQLGDIITKVTQPQSAIIKCGGSVLASHIPRIDQYSDRNFSRHVRPKPSNLSLEGFAKIKSEVEYQYDFPSLETSEFQTSEELFSTIGKLEGVRSYLKATKYKLPLYLVDGLMEVRDGTLVRKASRSVEYGFRNMRKSASRRSGQTTLDGKSSYVFAIRLCKLTCNKNGEVHGSRYTIGASI